MTDTNRRLYVGNLPYTATNDDLRAHVVAMGLQPSDVHVVMDRETGNGRGFGFVEFPTGALATAAIEILNGSQVDGRSVSVSLANPKPPKSGGGGYREPRADRTEKSGRRG
jgi:RNA recognition motif-containing protein